MIPAGAAVPPTETRTSTLVIALDAERRIVLFSRPRETLTGYAPGETVGKSLLDLLVPDSGRVTVAEHLAASSADELGAPQVSPRCTKSGEKRWIEWRYFALSELGGPSLIGVGREVRQDGAGGIPGLTTDTTEDERA